MGKGQTRRTMMRALELFAGAGGMALGMHRAGMETAGLVEWDAHAQRVLAARFPGVPLYGDVQEFDGAAFVQEHGPVDLVSGGSPCQDLSVAGKREGLGGARSGLFHQQMRIWEETGATYCLWENVLGALSSAKGADFAAVLSAFVGRDVAVPLRGWRGGAGVVSGPAGVAAWRVLDAQFFGVPQRRRRVFVLGARPGGVDPAWVLLERESLCGDFAESGEAREGVAGATAGGARGGRWWDGSDIAPTLDASALVKRQTMPDKGRFPCVMDYASPVAPSLPASGAGTARTGNERTEAELVVVQAVDKQTGQVTEGITATLKTDLAHQMGPVVAQGTIGWDDECNASGEIMGTLQSGGKASGSRRYGVVAIHENQRGEVREGVVASALAGGGGKPGQGYAAVLAGRPRRLMPVECERLMGWEDGWTLVPFLSGSHKAKCREHPATMQEVEDADGKIVELLIRVPIVVSLGHPVIMPCCGAKLKPKPMADAHRYKMCGNGVVSHVAEWIGRELLAGHYDE
jgi:DNA (cytosine-5)-methyltransferase 1